MLQSLILYADREQVVPKDVLEAALTNVKSIGIATVDNGAIEVNRELKAPKLDPLIQMLEMFKDAPMVIALSYTNDNNIDDVQPFVVFKDEKEKPLVVAFIQGDTSVLPKIKAKLTKEYKVADSDEEFWKGIGETDAEKGGSALEIKALLNDGSALVLMNTAGELWSYQQGEVEKNFDWGSSYGAPEASGGGKPTAATPQPADAPKRSLGSVSGTTPVAAPQQIAAATNTDGKPMARIHKQDISKLPEELRGRVNDTSGAVVKKNNSEPTICCPEMIDGKQVDRDMNHRWHAANIVGGVIPENWKAKPLWPASFSTKKVEVKDLKGTTGAEFAKDSAARVIPTSLMSDKDAVKALKEVLPKIYGSNQEQIGNPATIRKNEEAVKTIHELCERQFAFELTVPRLGRLMICTEYPDLAERMWGDQQNAYTDARARIAELEARVQKLDAELIEALEKATKPKGRALGSVG